MITTQKMTNAVLALHRGGENLVDASMVRDRLYKVTLTQIPCLRHEIPNIVRDAVREKLDRDVDDRFPGKIVSTILGTENGDAEDEDRHDLAVGVSQVALDVSEDLLANGLPVQGRNFLVDGHETFLIPGDFLPSRKHGPAMGVLFFPDKSCSWEPVLAAYHAKRAKMADGVVAKHQQLTARKAERVEHGA